MGTWGLLVAAIRRDARRAPLERRTKYRSDPRPSINKMPKMVAMIEVAGKSVSGEKYANVKSEIGTGLAP